MHGNGLEIASSGKVQVTPGRRRREEARSGPPARMLIIENDVPAAERMVRGLESVGLACSWECVSSAAALQDALTRHPDVILCDADMIGTGGMDALEWVRRASPQTPLIVLSDNVEDPAVQRALHEGAFGYVSKTDVTGLAGAVRAGLRRKPKGSPALRQGRRALAGESSGIADYLIERREVLDRTLREHDRSAMSMIMRRTPPYPAALMMIDAPSVRDRFGKLLRNANIDIDEAGDVGAALTQLEQRIHAVMFTDSLDLVVAARHLYAGAVTHVVFVNNADASSTVEALRAGANECMPAEPGGEEFWAHLTTARRIVSLAGYLQLALQDNRVLSTVDELTGCGSRRFFEQEFPREVERARQLRRPLGLVMCDIDHFKRVNDVHGHQTGDEVLIEFGSRLRAGLRLGRDWLARVGGEEFAIVLPDTTGEEGVAIAERLRKQIMTTPFWTTAGAISVTASFGVSGLSPSGRKTEGVAQGLIEAADQAMYVSKRAGRNRVTPDKGPGIR
jgi:diguanylate cyclase (GGDEF)-like protein